jgi:hypothetical protein
MMMINALNKAYYFVVVLFPKRETFLSFRFFGSYIMFRVLHKP